ncbi:DNA-binding response regulator [Mucilaginibacter hurinus]|uniref:DNA-binding response regulator n=1 Tax=Mucilaginibacter hurinus TaxID=2201324 RepID=A0A367GMQ2_9SPHI|nr:LytTR family DNA-binding domain-containing protein [Mucilaginibacter hurinus]RCH54754.1 DNA-binding response regulator [Mucilaginibacter hurinus]
MNCIIVDDEPLARKGMEQLISNTPYLKLLATFKSPQGVDAFLQEHSVDLILLDINMPGINGLEFARTVPKNTLIIFTTAHSEYATESYEVEAIDYLLKPISLQRFTKAVEKALSYYNLLNNEKSSVDNVADSHIYIRADRRFHKIALSDIIYIEGLKDYVVLHTREQKYITWMNIKTIQSKLPRSKFLRINKRYVINRNEVLSFNSNTVWLKNVELPIGKAYQHDFLKSYNGNNKIL